jgi:Aminoglycoside-2''''-adenylyltransferase.
LTPTNPEQLAALAEIDQLLQSHGIAYWLFGGWAVDFHAGRVTRQHEDLDLAVRSADRERVADLLTSRSWQPLPDASGDGYTCYARGAVRVDVTFLATDDRGRVYTPLEDGRGEWPERTFGEDVLHLHGISARVISREALIADKSAVHDDPLVAAKDRADIASLANPPGMESDRH